MEPVGLERVVSERVEAKRLILAACETLTADYMAILEKTRAQMLLTKLGDDYIRDVRTLLLEMGDDIIEIVVQFKHKVSSVHRA